jgi:hypothetical protein
MGAQPSPSNPARSGSAPPDGSGLDAAASRTRVAALPPGNGAALQLDGPGPLSRARPRSERRGEYIVEWAREAPARAPLALVITWAAASAHAGRRGGDAGRRRARVLPAARAGHARAPARLFRVGRISLLIGLAFVGRWRSSSASRSPGIVGTASYGRMIVDALVIGAWVALWRPLEIFLYDWWPIRAEARLYDRLSRIDVQVTGPRTRKGLRHERRRASSTARAGVTALRAACTSASGSSSTRAPSRPTWWSACWPLPPPPGSACDCCRLPAGACASRHCAAAVAALPVAVAGARGLDVARRAFTPRLPLASPASSTIRCSCRAARRAMPSS